MIVKLANAAFGFHKSRTYADMYANGKAAATEQRITALGDGPVGRFLSGPTAEGGMMYKIAKRIGGITADKVDRFLESRAKSALRHRYKFSGINHDPKIGQLIKKELGPEGIEAMKKHIKQWGPS